MYDKHYYLTIPGTVVDTHGLNYSSLTPKYPQHISSLRGNTYTTQVSKQRTPGRQGHFLLHAI